MNKYILRNAFRTPDGTIIESCYRHDYVCYTDKVTGKEYCTDGGLDYVRAIGDINDCENLCIYGDENTTFEILRKYKKWGSYGKDGKQPVTFKSICDLDDDHLDTLIEGGWGGQSGYDKLFIQEKEYRQHNKLI